MKIFAQIKDSLIVNKANFKDDSELPKDCIDVTGIRCNINDPIVDGMPVSKPTKWHTLLGLEWVITPEDQSKKDDAESKLSRSSKIIVAQQSSGMKIDTVEGAEGKIENIFINIRKKPEGEQLEALINKCEIIFKKIAVELLK